MKNPKVIKAFAVVNSETGESLHFRLLGEYFSMALFRKRNEAKAIPKRFDIDLGHDGKPKVVEVEIRMSMLPSEIRRLKSAIKESLSTHKPAKSSGKARKART